MKIYCKKCKADRFVVTGNTTYCIKCNTPIYITKEFPIYTQTQMIEAKEQAYYAGYEDGVSDGIMIGLGYAPPDESIAQKFEKIDSKNFYMKRFTKVE